ncbi:MAG TPA: hypothetical protein VFS20_20890 [Longimicrobium sp.]|nr:hypothetical protein [Longimicrobium sp.]
MSVTLGTMATQLMGRIHAEMRAEIGARSVLTVAALAAVVDSPAADDRLAGG